MGPLHEKSSHQVCKAVVWNRLVNTVSSRVVIHRLPKTSFSFIPCSVSIPASDWERHVSQVWHYQRDISHVPMVTSQWRSQTQVDCCSAPIWPSGILYIMFRYLRDNSFFYGWVMIHCLQYDSPVSTILGILALSLNQMFIVSTFCLFQLKIHVILSDWFMTSYLTSQ